MKNYDSRLGPLWIKVLSLATVLCSSLAHSQALSERPDNATCLAPDRPQVPYAAQEVFAGLNITKPIHMMQPPGDEDRWLLGERSGLIISFDNDPDTTEQDTILDLTSALQYTVNADSQQYGLVGFDLHPNFPVSPFIYVAYNAKPDPASNVFSVLVRYTSNDGGETFDISTEQVVMSVEQPSPWHHFGTVAFGPDGYLYIGLGENGTTATNNAQNLHDLQGSILRIDVDGGTPYTIPADNPLVASGYREEIYAWGLRNPWRFSFDRLTGDLYAGDVGADRAEEVNLIVNGGNYGWNDMIGTECRFAGCDTSGFTDPELELDHDVVTAVIGGFMYRGSDLPSLYGKYVFSNAAGKTVRAMSYDGSGNASQTAIFEAPVNFHSFAEDLDGELYGFQSYGGKIFKIVSAGAPAGDPLPDLLSELGCFNQANMSEALEGVIPYGVNSKLWSDGAEKARWMAIPDGTTVDLEDDGDFDFPIGSVLLKEFAFQGMPFETRLLVRHDDGGWGAYTYEWNDSGTDAELVDETGKVKTLTNGLDWKYPSKEECFACHTDIALTVLGVETLQLNGDYHYPSSGITANQLETLDHIGYFSAGLPDTPDQMPALVEVDEADASVEDRARSYLHSNCSGCHRPDTLVTANWDAMYQATLADMDVCNITPDHGDLGVPGAKLVTPGDGSSSVILGRTLALDEDRMPPIGTNLIDVDGTNILDIWINQISTCADDTVGRTVYEDAEDGTTDGWIVKDNDPPGATITNIFDPSRQGRIIVLTGDGKNNSYELSLGNNSNQFVAQWSGKFDDVYSIEFVLQTTDGTRRLLYAPNDRVGYVFPGGANIEFGLGASSADGNWHTFTRDLQADLHVVYPDTDIEFIRTFKVNGSGSIDDLRLLDELDEEDPEDPNDPQDPDPEPIEYRTMYEDAEDSVSSRWTIVDNDPSGAAVTNVYSADKQSRVIVLTGSGKDNSYQLGLGNNDSQFVLQWEALFPSAYSVIVNMTTDTGTHRLIYRPVDYDEHGIGENIKYGIGASTRDGAWHKITRDLAADLHAARPGVDIVSVDSLKVSGSGEIDNVQLMQFPGVVLEDAEDGSTDGWSVSDNDPAGASIENEYNSDRGDRVILFSGAGKENSYDLSPDEDHLQFIAHWSSRFNQAYSLQFVVDTDEGTKRLIYHQAETDNLGTGVAVTHGLGTYSANGEWHNFTRNLVEDLHRAQPGIIVTRVTGVRLSGSGRLDDIKLLSDTGTNIEDGEDLDTAGWSVVDNDPPGASITNVFDSSSQSQVIEFSGDGKNNGYEISTDDNDRQFIMRWESNFNEAASIEIIVNTDDGTRRLVYYQAESDDLGTDKSVLFGLGSQFIDGQWHGYTRNLKEDLRRAQPNRQLQSVKSFRVNGSGRVDNVKLIGGGLYPEEVPLPPGC